MAKMTLLEIVQNILSAMDSDEVNSITDTVESLQVAMVVKETYEEQFNNINKPEFKGLILLDGISDVTKPNYLKVPTTVRNFDWIRYKDTRHKSIFAEVLFMPPEDFLKLQFNYTSTGKSLFLTTDPISGVQYYVKNNRVPMYYTSFDNSYLAFDSFDATYESTLHASNTAAFGTKFQQFVIDDAFIPFLDENLFPLLLAESKSVAFVNFKQVSSQKEEQRAHRQRIRMQNDQFKSKPQQAARKIFNYARTR